MYWLTQGSASVLDRFPPGWFHAPLMADFKAKGASQVTHLFVSPANPCRKPPDSFYHLAIRLETMQAVQHHLNGSFQFEPLHSIGDIALG